MHQPSTLTLIPSTRNRSPPNPRRIPSAASCSRRIGVSWTRYQSRTGGQLARRVQRRQVVDLVGQPDHLVDRRDPEAWTSANTARRASSRSADRGSGRPWQDRSCRGGASPARGGCPSARRRGRARSGHREGLPSPVDPGAPAQRELAATTCLPSRAARGGGHPRRVVTVRNRPSASPVAVRESPGPTRRRDADGAGGTWPRTSQIVAGSSASKSTKRRRTIAARWKMGMAVDEAGSTACPPRSDVRPRAPARAPISASRADRHDPPVGDRDRRPSGPHGDLGVDAPFRRMSPPPAAGTRSSRARMYPIDNALSSIRHSMKTSLNPSTGPRIAPSTADERRPGPGAARRGRSRPGGRPPRR